MYGGPSWHRDRLHIARGIVRSLIRFGRPAEESPQRLQPISGSTGAIGQFIAQLANMLALQQNDRLVSVALTHCVQRPPTP
jgi:hypothetical protein